MIGMEGRIDVRQWRDRFACRFVRAFFWRRFACFANLHGFIELHAGGCSSLCIVISNLYCLLFLVDTDIIVLVTDWRDLISSICGLCYICDFRYVAGTGPA